MSIPSLGATPSNDTGIGFQLSTGGSVVCVDFRSMAGIIDAVAGFDPARLASLFPIIWETHFKLETRAVLQAAVACRDPLSDLGTICKDALGTFADLEKITKAHHWRKMSSVIGHQHPRACALLNACDYQIANLPKGKQAPYRTARTRLEIAAAAERLKHGEEMQVYAQLRQARCPNIWETYEDWREKE